MNRFRQPDPPFTSGSFGLIRAGEDPHPHTHEHWEMLRILKGTGIAWTEQGEAPFTPGSILCIPPHTQHVNLPDVAFQDFAIQCRQALLPGGQVHVLHDDEPGSMLQLMRLYDRFARQKARGFENILMGLELTMQNLLLSWQEKAGPAPELLNLLAEMREHLADPGYQVSDSMEKLPLSVNYVRKLFRQSYGASPVAYLNQMRLHQAKKYLLAGTLPVSEIAEKCGYAGVSYFSRVFRAETGFSPLAYRKQFRPD